MLSIFLQVTHIWISPYFMTNIKNMVIVDRDHNWSWNVGFAFHSWNKAWNWDTKSPVKVKAKQALSSARWWHLWFGIGMVICWSTSCNEELHKHGSLLPNPDKAMQSDSKQEMWHAHERNFTSAGQCKASHSSSDPRCIGLFWPGSFWPPNGMC